VRVDVRAGDYDALADAALVSMTAGVNEKAGGATDRSDPQGRLRLLDQDPGRQPALRVHPADRLQVRPRDVQAMVVGEHGTSEVLLCRRRPIRHATKSPCHQPACSAPAASSMPEPAMTSDERAALERSAAALREAARRVLAVGP
jgi:hypothetical protein